MDNIVASNIEMKKRMLERKKTRATFGTLKRKVVNPGLCIECGKCVALCDVIDWDGENREPRLVGKCIACGLCYNQCPQSPGSPVGDFKDAWITRSMGNDITGQDGGTVTAIVLALLESNLIEAAILTRQDPGKPWHPEPFIATTREDVLSASKTIYTHSPVIPVLIKAISQGYRKIAVVATACKITAIHDLQDEQQGVFQGIDDLEITTIGLFCSESFLPERLLAFLGTKVDPDDITKMRISNGTMWVHTTSGKETFGLTSYAEEFHGCTKESCLNCNDFTSEQADISVGNIGTDSRHNTVLVRTSAGARAFDNAVHMGIIDAKPAGKEILKPVLDLAWEKKMRGIDMREVVSKPGRFIRHPPRSWNIDEFEYSPVIHPERYKRVHHETGSINSVEDGPKIIIAATPNGTKEEMTTYNYSTAYDVTRELLQDFKKLDGGKVFIKPNNTGFVGIFKHNPDLEPILEKNGITDDADHQPLATQPSTLQGIVDAMLDLGAKEIHVGENMLWEGGTPRAFYETGYCDVFCNEKYDGKVFFIDFYENDPPPGEFKKLAIKEGDHDISSYYKRFYPPVALFEEQYALVFIASIAKVHNCSHYSLTAKNFSVSMNPRKKSGKVEPRWHIHGVPIEVFRKKYLRGLFGESFKRRYQYLVRETYNHLWNASIRDRSVKLKKSRIILSGRLASRLGKSLPATFHSSGLMSWFKSYRQWVLNVDPHHWAGTCQLAMNLGIGYLITRFTGMYAAMVDALREQGTEVAGLVSGIVAQEGDGPLIYGNVKHGGFTVAGFDAAATERVCLDLMFGDEPGGFEKAIVRHQETLMSKYNVRSEKLVEEAKCMWSLALLAKLTGGTIDTREMDMILLDYTGTHLVNRVTPETLHELRAGPPFTFSEAFYCSPDTWLYLIHKNDDIFRIAFLYTIKSIEIPLIPDVVG
ncbi:DUF362 domain-containing protein [Candidatus Bathyarchaeota archaeon]|nr:DUF362 domain-containing protein [Candidatus Bathyarchaeota archaeon]